MILRTIRDALRDLRLQPGRAGLTTFTLMLGVIAVVATAIASAVVNDVLIAGEEQRNGRAITVAAALNPTTATSASLERLEHAGSTVVTGGGGYALYAELPAARVWSSHVVPRPGSPPTRVTLVGGALPQVRRLPLVAGRWLRPYSTDQPLPVEIVINQAAATWLGPVGGTASLATTVYEPAVQGLIVGVAADGADEPTAYASLSTVLQLRPSTRLTSMALLVHHPWATVNRLVDVASAIAGYADMSLVGTPVRIDGVDKYREQLATARSALTWLAAFSLLLAALGTMNIGFSSLATRRREFVIRRALGARRVDLFALVIVHALTIAALALPLGLGIAAAGIYGVVPQLVPISATLNPPAFPWSAALIACGGAALAAILGAAAPAAAAARADVANALRA